MDLTKKKRYAYNVAIENLENFLMPTTFRYKDIAGLMLWRGLLLDI